MTDFWGVPDASIRFGEPKHAWSPVVFEFWNSLSSLWYVLVACAFHVPGRPVRAHEVALAAVGLCSALLHGTGRRWAQLADEFSMLAWTWCVIQALGVPPVLSRGLWSATAAAMTAYVAHGHFAWFFVVFSLHVLALVRGLWSLRLAGKEKASCVLTFAAAAVFWLLEQLNPAFWIGHVGWHLCSAVAAGLLHLSIEIQIELKIQTTRHEPIKPVKLA
jgi:hypothetical protein